MTATTAIGLGKGLGLFFAWVDTKLREHYNPKSKQTPAKQTPAPTDLASVSAVFFDKNYIRNLKA
jgi:hypothetical protein